MASTEEGKNQKNGELEYTYYPREKAVPRLCCHRGRDLNSECSWNVCHDQKLRFRLPNKNTQIASVYHINFDKKQHIKWSINSSAFSKLLFSELPDPFVVGLCCSCNAFSIYWEWIYKQDASIVSWRKFVWDWA
jgi:hypothetical protein